MSLIGWFGEISMMEKLKGGEIASTDEEPSNDIISGSTTDEGSRYISIRGVSKILNVLSIFKLEAYWEEKYIK